MVVDNDFVLNVGRGSITLKDVVGKGVKSAKVKIGDADATSIPISKIIQGTKSAETLATSAEDKGYKIDALAGNDKITVSGESTTVLAGAGNDTIKVTAGVAGIKIEGGAGNDVVTIDGGSTDSVGRYYVYGASDGTDTIYGFNENDTLEFADTITTSISDNGENFILKSGKTSVVIAQYFANNLSGKTFTTLKTAEEGETATSDKATVSAILQGTKKADESLTLDKDNHTVLGLAGNDIITGNASNISIDGGAGNDVISVTAAADKVTINGGTGDDEITIETVAAGSEKAHTFVYASGDGNDNVYGYNAADSINLYDADGKTTLATDSYTTSISDKDFVITVGKGKITLKDVVGTLTKTTINGEEVSIEQVIQGNDKVIQYGVNYPSVY